MKNRSTKINSKAGIVLNELIKETIEGFTDIELSIFPNNSTIQDFGISKPTEEFTDQEWINFINNFIFQEFGMNGRTEHRILYNADLEDFIINDPDRPFMTIETEKRLDLEISQFLNRKYGLV